ncbi:transcription termination/antitermination protein NusG [Candidatus Mycoplasma haematominutum]|uniref:Transcription termination/antitermination protein NusG n=1 Tax=Candidatus Mycoplasma haematominutum 'Birmingham 1' TaxID=1116213 RepID=G8C2H7_9MOLU|nr:transcription termination/antitermination protein NusG [Candidatus Mycoplasma haematominutum]CCE66525.1 transcription antitermination factor [Candidatus Mycoplasma haematominutum 'Birmingham 1']
MSILNTLRKGKKQWLENDDFDRDMLDRVAADSPESQFKWFSARVYISNELRVIDSLWDKVRQCKLEDSIKEIISIRETVIEESHEIFSESSELPKKEFRNSKNGVWVQLKNGNFKKINLKVKRPFPCFIFFRMVEDYEIFSLIHSWALGIGFLGFPKPNLISDQEISNMRNTVKTEVPDINKYIKVKDYQIISGPVSKFVTPKSQDFSTEIEEEGDKLLEGKDLQYSKDGLARDPIIDTGIVEESERRSVSLQTLKVNDFVYLVEMGTRGVVREIDAKNQIVTVHINLFGRNQIVKCDLNQLKEF